MNLTERQPRTALLLLFVLGLYLLHTWHVQTTSEAVLKPSNSLSWMHPPSVLDSFQDSTYTAPIEYVDGQPDLWSMAGEHMAEDDIVKSEFVDSSTKPTIAKVSMLYGENPEPVYVRALRSHLVHNKRFNYAMFVLTEEAIGGFWNKPMYLLSLMIQELSKPSAERLRWLM